jgi:hypothetical protein
MKKKKKKRISNLNHNKFARLKSIVDSARKKNPKIIFAFENDEERTGRKMHTKNLNKLFSVLHGITVMKWSRYDAVPTNMCC